MGALESEGRTYTIALLGCGWPNNKTYKWADAKTLFGYGKENFEYISTETIEESTLMPEKLRVVNGQTQSIGEEAKVHLSIVEKEKEINVLGKASEVFFAKVSLPEKLHAPVEEGEKVGSISYLLGGEVYMVKDIVLARGVEAVDYRWCLDRVMDVFLLF